MEDQPATPTATTPTNPQLPGRIAGVIAAGVAVLYGGLWLSLPSDWSPAHAGGKWFLPIFIVTSAVAAVLASGFFRSGARARDEPAAWLGIQVLFWNPLAYRGVLSITGAIGLPSDYSGAVALAGLVLLGLPTSLIGAALCRSPSWIAVYLTRAVACLFAAWVPLLPSLIFLHVLWFAHLVTWNKYGRCHNLAVYLITAEQLAAAAWILLFSRLE